MSVPVSVSVSDPVPVASVVLSVAVSVSDAVVLSVVEGSPVEPIVAVIDEPDDMVAELPLSEVAVVPAVVPESVDDALALALDPVKASVALSVLVASVLATLHAVNAVSAMRPVRPRNSGIPARARVRLGPACRRESRKQVIPGVSRMVHSVAT